MTSRFLQVHALTSYPAALLNRDDAGFAKSIRFGGVPRIRVSSQCLKRHWRCHEGEHALDNLELPRTVRSRLTFHVHLLEPLAEEFGEERAWPVAEALVDAVLGKSAKKEKVAASEVEGAASKTERVLRTSQVTVMGRPELDYLLELGRQACREASDAKSAAQAAKEALGKDGKKNLKALGLASGLGAALFGRMVTSDLLARGDAAVHVAHALTVHAAEAEPDYFSAVDDLAAAADENSLGSGHVNTADLTSGLYYIYLAVDLPLLVSNLTGCAAEDAGKADSEAASKVLETLVHLVAKVSPGAKLGSTAPHAYAQAVLAEAGSAQPRTLANAFLEPVRADGRLLARTYESLGRHVAELDRMYGRHFERRLAALGDCAGLADAAQTGEPVSLDELAAWAGAQVREL